MDRSRSSATSPAAYGGYGIGEPDGVLAPRYRGVRTGRLATDPLTVAGDAPAVDVAALARLFTGPVLSGEFTPAAFWHGVRLEWDLPDPRPGRGRLAWTFDRAVTALCADAATIGVTLSGGLDSLAVLCRVVELRPARRLVAYHVDLADDRGIGSAGAARRLLDRVREVTGTAIDLVVVDPASVAAGPPWSAHGPRPDALPAANAAVADHAAADGVDVLLHGNGADELLGTPSFAALPVLAAHGPRGGRRYLADVARSGAGWTGEIVAAVADRFPRRARSRWYWAANWPAWCVPTVSPVVGAPFREQALAFAADWIGSRLDDHARHDRSWARADAADAFWPRAHVPRAGTVPEASPFLVDDVVATALTMSPAARYDPGLPSAYQRYKAAVVGLLPSWIHPALPRRKQYFTGALAAAAAGELPVPHSAAAGLLDPAAVTACADTATRMTAAAVEAWLAGALAAGFSVPGVDPS